MGTEVKIRGKEVKLSCTPEELKKFRDSQYQVVKRGMVALGVTTGSIAVSLFCPPAIYGGIVGIGGAVREMCVLDRNNKDFLEKHPKVE